MKPAKCKVCGTVFQKNYPFQKWCSVDCAVTLGQQAIEKKKAKEKAVDRKQTKEKLKTMRGKPELTKDAQKAVNEFIRSRDFGKPCISCQNPLGSEPNSYDAGHFRSVGSAPHMRFVESNIHGQCKHCNNYLGGNVLAYRKGLIERIGLEEVEKLESDNETRKYTHDELIEMAATYRKKTRDLKKSQT